MIDFLITVIGYLIWILIGVYFSWFIVARILEPIYIMIFNRPLYLYFYPVLKKASDAQRKILNDNVPFYRRLSPRRKKFFEHRIVDFIESYAYYGKNGLILTDEIYVMVASAYVMLTFGMRNFKTDVFNKIIIYPDSYHSTINDVLHNGEFNPMLKAVVFSWKHFREGFQVGSDNLNLGIHEFAHVLHFHGFKKNDRSAEIFADEYVKLMKEVKHPANAQRLIDSDYFRIYAYTNEYEFLAVILEHFFETPRDFEKEFPRLFKNVKRMINYQS